MIQNAQTAEERGKKDPKITIQSRTSKEEAIANIDQKVQRNYLRLII